MLNLHRNGNPADNKCALRNIFSRASVPWLQWSRTNLDPKCTFGVDFAVLVLILLFLGLILLFKGVGLVVLGVGLVVLGLGWSLQILS